MHDRLSLEELKSMNREMNELAEEVRKLRMEAENLRDRTLVTALCIQAMLKNEEIGDFLRRELRHITKG